MDFGFTLKPDHTVERTINLTRQAEDGGFSYGWLFDSHVLWKDPYPVLTIMALNTQRMRLGTCVTNPATRDPSVTASALATLNEISGGRMDLGIGRGDSARRRMGKPPTTLARLEEAASLIRDLVEGRTVDQDGTDLQLDVDAERQAARLACRLRAKGARAHSADRRRRNPPARGSGPDPLVRGPAA